MIKLYLILQSSLDRGCFSCECLILPDSKEGMLFWEKRLGKDKLSETLLKARRKDQVTHTTK